MKAPHKFLFDRSFDVLDAPRGVSNTPPPEPTFTRAEVTAARAAGAAEARAAALAEAARTTEACIAASLTTLADGITQVCETRQAYAEEAQRRALETARAILQKAAPALSRKAPLAEVEAVVADCLREAFDEPRIVLRVADSLFEALQQRLGFLTTSTGFAGKVVLLADENLGPGDARVEWAEGGAERDTGRLMRDIDGALARALDTLPVPGMSRPQENSHD